MYKVKESFGNTGDYNHNDQLSSLFGYIRLALVCIYSLIYEQHA